MTVKDVETGIDYKGVYSIVHDGSLIVLRSLCDDCLVTAYLNNELVFRCEKIILTKPNPEIQIYNWNDVEEHEDEKDN